MKIVNIIGGLGNQMFQYALYLALKDAHPDENVKLCTRCFRGYGLHNGLELQRIFGIQSPEASIWELMKVAYPIFNYKSWQIMFHYLPKRKTMTKGTTRIAFNEDEITRNDSVFYDGYWQNENNFKHIRELILQSFSFPVFSDNRNEKLASRLQRCNSVSIHIRRGDYLKEPVWCVCTPDYYRKGIDYIRKRQKIEFLCVFSDDIPWCQEHLREISKDLDIEYVDWNKGEQSYCDMQLMTYCRHNIIANSSFSWWGAWLGRHPQKIVVAPRLWANKPIQNDPVCQSWVRL